MVATAAGALAARPQAPAAPRSPKDGVFTAAQADRGKTVYDAKCAVCHGTMASVTPDMAPLLNDYVFQGTWKNRSLADLFGKIRETMPQNEPGTLSPRDTADIVAYVLSANHLPAGDVPLPEDVETLKQIRLEADPW
jgi:mono/diheme cytochrome c family protein